VRGWDNVRVLSEAQSKILVKNGINPDKLAYSQARQVIGEMFRRWDNKLCTAKQAQLLKRYGYETKNMKMDDATKAITAIKENGWKRPTTTGETHDRPRVETVVQGAEAGYDEQSPF
jgi:hypothetical protein